MIDLLVVGAGLYGAVFAQQAKAAGKRVKSGAAGGRAKNFFSCIPPF